MTPLPIASDVGARRFGVAAGRVISADAHIHAGGGEGNTVFDQRPAGMFKQIIIHIPIIRIAAPDAQRVDGGGLRELCQTRKRRGILQHLIM